MRSNKKYILIVEDEPLVADALKGMLCGTDRSGFACTAVGNLKQGLAHLSTKRCDIVLLDLGLPDAQGLEGPSLVRRQFEKVPIIVLTGLDDEKTALTALHMDIQDYLIKGQINVGILVRAVYYAIERKKMADAQRESEERLRMVVEAARALIYELDITTNRILILRGLKEVFGYDMTEITFTRDWWDNIIHPDDRDPVRSRVNEIIRNGNDYSIEYRVLHKSRQYITVQDTGKATRDARGKITGFVGGIVDISERKRAEENLRTAKELSEALNRINSLIYSTIEFDEIMQRVVGETAKATGADSAIIYVPKDGVWVARYIYGLPDYISGRLFTEDDIKYSTTAIKERRIVIDNDLARDKELCHSYITEFGVNALLDAPLLVGETVIGDFSLYSCRIGEVFNEQHVDFLNKVSSSVSLAVKNSSLFSELKRAQERASFFADAIANSSQPFAAGKPDGGLILYNKAFIELTGYTAQELKNMTWSVDLTPPEWQSYEAEIIGELHRSSQPQLYQKEYIRKNGMRVPIEVKVHLVRDEQGNPDYYYSFVTDITERKKTEQALRESEERFREAFTHAPIGMILTDPQGRYQYANRAYQDIVGYTEQELRQPGFDFRLITHPEDIEFAIREVNRLLAGEIPAFFIEKRYIRKDGHIVWVRLSSSVRRDADGRPLQMVGLVEDINERKRLEDEIKHLAHHDVLTGLPNRRLFNEIVEVEVAQARRYHRKLGIFFLDIDRFKEINDTLGHEAGDELLRQAALRLKGVIRTSDTISRIGGDEFNLVLADISYPEYAADVARKILSEIQKPFMIRGHQINVSTSIGISVFPDDSTEMDALLRYADMALYYAKEHGRNMFQFYNPIINSRSLERVRFEANLRHAIEHGELHLYFQPIIDVKTMKIASVEALVRWQHPAKGLLLPEHFFGQAEDIGFMPMIDEWVLNTVSRQMKAWLDEDLFPMSVTVNLSAREFQNPELVNRISGILRRTGLPPECLDIEITEATAMGNLENSIQRLHALSEMGVHVSLDDFGAGYSSLNQIKRLPVGKLKIDKSIIRNIATSSDDQAIVTAMTVMAHALKLKVVAEGVESENQFTYLKDLQCDQAQGFLFSEPVPCEKFRDMVTAAR